LLLSSLNNEQLFQILIGTNSSESEGTHSDSFHRFERFGDSSDSTVELPAVENQLHNNDAQANS
jgi:hypothetical protein